MKASDTTFELQAIADACANTAIPNDVAEAERLIAAAKAAEAELQALILRHAVLAKCEPEMDCYGRCAECGRFVELPKAGERRGCVAAFPLIRYALTALMAVPVFGKALWLVLRSSAAGSPPPVAPSGEGADLSAHRSSLSAISQEARS